MFWERKWWISFFVFSVVVAGGLIAGEPSALVKRGEALAKLHCASCHDYTPPELLPQRSWDFLLTYMGLRLGIDETSRFDSASATEQQVLQSRHEMLRQSGLWPNQPALLAADWAALRAFYLNRAPHRLTPDAPREHLPRDLPLFAEKPHGHHPSGALTSLVRILPDRGQVLIGDSRRGVLSLHDPQLNPIVEYDARNASWVDAEFDEAGVYLLSIGDLAGDFVGQKLGRILRAENEGEVFVPRGEALGGLYRPADMARGDLDSDGQDEMVVAEFGLETGRVTIRDIERNAGTLSAEPVEVLHVGPGAVKVAIHDFNADGRNDVAVVISDAREKLVVYENEGNLRFSPREVLTAHPAFGYVGFELVDFDQDGRMDIITVNGDNVDSDPYNTVKPYHGVRLYQNVGGMEFKEEYFFSFPGAYGVEVADFDADGDMDLVAIAFNPDFNALFPEGFVYLEQTSPMEFVARTHPAASAGRWLTMDAGDFDNDGDVDLVLGGGYVPAGLLPDNPRMWQTQSQIGRALLVLENQTVR